MSRVGDPANRLLLRPGNSPRQASGNSGHVPLVKPAYPMSFPTHVLIPALLALVVTAAQSGRAQGAFDLFDRNRDGLVTRDELPDAATFALFDADGDGLITREEYARVAAGGGPAAGRLIAAVLARFDADGDGRITRAEAGGAPWFDRADTNGDGVIDAAELENVRRLLTRGGTGRAGAPQPAPVISEPEIQRAAVGAELVKPGDAGIGRLVPDLAFTDLEGRAQSLGALLRGRKALVIAMTSSTCPVSKRYLPSLARLEGELARQDVALLLVNPFASETVAAIRAQLAAFPMTATYVHDRDRALAAGIRAHTTTEVLLLDAARTLIYRGALDDQYGLGHALDAPRRTYLRDALGALLRGERPSVQATTAPGCELDPASSLPVPSASPVTYHRDVSRILQQNCVGCHRDGGIAPFALDDID